MTPDFVADFRRNHRGKLTEIRYPEGGHGLREGKPHLGDGAEAWLRASWPIWGPA